MASRLETVWFCEACGHKWLASNLVKPKQCARCKSRKWDTLHCNTVTLEQGQAVTLEQQAKKARKRGSSANPPPIRSESAHHSHVDLPTCSVGTTPPMTYSAEAHHLRCTCAKCVKAQA